MAGPQFIRPDPNLIPPESRTVARIVKSLQGTATFLEKIKQRKFEQARAQVADERAAQLNELTKQSIALKKLQLDGEFEDRKSKNDKTTLDLGRSGDLNEKFNQMINDPTLINGQSLQSMTGEASLLLDGAHAKQAGEIINWATQQDALLVSNSSKSQISEYNELAQTGRAAETREELNPRKNIGAIIRGADESNKPVYGFKESVEFNQAAITFETAKLERAAADAAAAPQEIPAPAKPKLDEEGKPIKPLLTVQIEPFPTALGVSGLLGDPAFMEVMAAHPPLRERFEELGGDTQAFKEVRVGDKSIFLHQNVPWAFAKDGTLMQANQIPAANKAFDAPEKIPTGSFFAPGLKFDGPTTQIVESDGSSVTVARTNVPDQFVVVNRFPGRKDDDSPTEKLIKLLGEKEGGEPSGAAPVREVRGVPPVRGNVPSQVGQPISINVSFSGGDLVIEK